MATSPPWPKVEKDPAANFENRLRSAIAMVRIDAEHAKRVVRGALDYLEEVGTGQASFDATFNCPHDEIDDGILGFDGRIGGTCTTCKTPVAFDGNDGGWQE